MKRGTMPSGFGPSMAQARKYAIAETNGQSILPCAFRRGRSGFKTATYGAANPFATLFNPMKNQPNQPSFARCVLHLRAINRNPSQFRFYLSGILREFKECGTIAICFVFTLFIFGLSIVNSFFQ
jgi:hypothetical protein